MRKLRIALLEKEQYSEPEEEKLSSLVLVHQVAAWLTSESPLCKELLWQQEEYHPQEWKFLKEKLNIGGISPVLWWTLQSPLMFNSNVLWMQCLSMQAVTFRDQEFIGIILYSQK